ncbi:MAG TPA: Txe/YoeB family addiction module toxin, partial [Armatimonadota bacterium]|nr:Txe/YoeB family addiction module toxin [Armatimonadota bacterium]
MSAANRRRRVLTPPADPAERQAILRAAFLADLTFWIKNDPRVALRVMKLIDDVLRNPFSGIGKPEPLRYAPDGLWSRRITGEHRIVYEVNPNGILFNVA